MRIRTLDQDLNSNQLEITRGSDGDVYVTIYKNSAESKGQTEYCGEPFTVRVGMAGSGMHLPGNLSRIFGELADEFEEYKDCTFESDACGKDGAWKPMFENITRLYDDLDPHTNEWSVALFKMRHAPRPYLLSRTHTGNWFTYQCEAWKMETWKNMTIDEAMASAIANIID